MRVWDVEPRKLCRKHLLGEHRELHGLWNILTVHNGQGGYANHPETKRWVGKLKALYLRHEKLVSEMESRGYKHRSPLDKNKATGSSRQTQYIDSIQEQMKLLENKPCDCLRDKAKHQIPLPKPLTALLNKNKVAKEQFNKLAPSHQKAYIEWINQAKKPKTQIKRAQQTIKKVGG